MKYLDFGRGWMVSLLRRMGGSFLEVVCENCNSGQVMRNCGTKWATTYFVCVIMFSILCADISDMNIFALFSFEYENIFQR